MNLIISQEDALENIVERAVSNAMRTYLQPAQPEPEPSEGGIELAQEVLKVYSKSSIYKMRNRMPHTKRGKKLWYTRESLLQWLADGMPDLRDQQAADEFQKLVKNRKL